MPRNSIRIILLLALTTHAHAGQGPLIHYLVDSDPVGTVVDRSGNGHDGVLTGVSYVEEVEGQKGVLRFQGEGALLEIANEATVHPHGDMTFEMRIRRHAPVMASWATLFGDGHDFALFYAQHTSLVLWYEKRHPDLGHETTLIPMDRTLFDETWSHLAVVIEYPRCRIYKDGALLRDAYMPLEGINNSVVKNLRVGKDAPMDLHEFRLYHRALTPDEIAAHAAGREIEPNPTRELAVEPHWYDDTITLRLSARDTTLNGHTVQFSLDPVPSTGGRTSREPGPDNRATHNSRLGQATRLSSPKSSPSNNPIPTPLGETSPGSGRYTASAAFPLAEHAGQSLTATAQLLDPEGIAVASETRELTVARPDWVHSPEGRLQSVPAPWTPVAAGEGDDGLLQVDVWGRRYVFGDEPWPRQIVSGGEPLLAGPIAVTGRVAGETVTWGNAETLRDEPNDLAVTLKYGSRNDTLQVIGEATVAFDGYVIIAFAVAAMRDVSLDELTLDIPLHTRFAELCYGDRVYPPDNAIPINEWHSGAVTGDLAFRFGPTVWLGENEKGLLWQSESDEHWRNADRQRAIEILPRGETTTFRAHFVDQATELKAGDELRYRFALQATPIKPIRRDAWDLRVVRYEPYGDEALLPDRTIGDRPAAEHFAGTGMRHLLTLGCELWPYPLPVTQGASNALHRLHETLHAQGIKVFDYQLHQRFPTAAPGFEIHGRHMALRKMAQYIPGNNPPGDPRQGPVETSYGTHSQGCIFACPKSMALQDAYLHAVGRRLDTFKDDGIYLDGTCHIPPCKNPDHGCGYRTPDGTLRATYPVFAVREYMQRIYAAVKQRNPDNVVDLHCSWGYNPAGLAYADCMWTGEQWWHLRKTNSDYVAGDLTLDRFRTEFTGWHAGTGCDVLHYRLGNIFHVAAVSLLHDIPSRPSTRTVDKPNPFFELLQQLWQLRDRFDAENAERLYYFENEDYVQAGPDKVYATLLRHPENGVLAFISNLGRDTTNAEVRFNLDALGLTGVTAINGLTGESIPVTPEGTLTKELETHGWIYAWLRGTE